MSIKELEIIDGVAQYDLIVIGSGSGNTLIGPEWDNKKVALIDGGTFGGTCLNVGCIPTKMFVYPATTAQKARELNKLGIEAEILQLTGHRYAIVFSLSASIRFLLVGVTGALVYLMWITTPNTLILLMLTQCRQSPGRNFMVARL